jgi:endonuclease/exonuclease/phosphatase (EEP) superfamily protein YafD
VGRVHVTLPFADLPLAGLSIDHVLAPGPGMTEVRRLNGSDHLGLLARFTVSG